MPEQIQQHFQQSSHRELILTHRFLADVLQHIWKHFPKEPRPQILTSAVDDNGYDLVIEWRRAVRHIQLKATIGNPQYLRVNRNLGEKPAGCVILMTCSEDLASVSYMWLGSHPGHPISAKLDKFAAARQLRRSADGKKAITVSTCLAPTKELQQLPDIPALVEALFPAPATL